MSTLFVIDIDGTIADASRRFKAAGPEPNREDKSAYTAWVEAVQNRESLKADPEVPGMGALTRTLHYSDSVDIIFLTSREEKWRPVTDVWLINLMFPASCSEVRLLMRPNDSWEETEVFKERVIELLAPNYSAVVVIDDDPSGKLAEVCKRRGWTFLKALSGS